MTPSSVEGRRSDAEPVFALQDAVVDFGQFRAVDHVSIEVRRGEVVGLIGPNGAGKSTIINAAVGAVRLTSGHVVLEHTDITSMSTVRRARLGLGRTFQTASLFDSLTLDDNLSVARHAARLRKRHAGVTDLTGDRDYRKDLGVRAPGAQQGRALSGGERKLTEVARSLTQMPRMLLLDEPVAGVPQAQRQQLLTAVRKYVNETATASLLVEHDMNFIAQICDWIYVTDRGRLICEGNWSDVSTDKRVVEAYIGTE